MAILKIGDTYNTVSFPDRVRRCYYYSLYSRTEYHETNETEVSKSWYLFKCAHWLKMIVKTNSLPFPEDRYGRFCLIYIFIPRLVGDIIR